jgi:hypothetical protein
MRGDHDRAVTEVVEALRRAATKTLYWVEWQDERPFSPNVVWCRIGRVNPKLAAELAAEPVHAWGLANFEDGAKARDFAYDIEQAGAPHVRAKMYADAGRGRYNLPEVSLHTDHRYRTLRMAMERMQDVTQFLDVRAAASVVLLRFHNMESHYGLREYDAAREVIEWYADSMETGAGEAPAATGEKETP